MLGSEFGSKFLIDQKIDFILALFKPGDFGYIDNRPICNLTKHKKPEIEIVCKMLRMLGKTFSMFLCHGIEQK